MSLAASPASILQAPAWFLGAKKNKNMLVFPAWYLIFAVVALVLMQLLSPRGSLRSPLWVALLSLAQL